MTEQLRKNQPAAAGAVSDTVDGQGQDRRGESTTVGWSAVAGTSQGIATQTPPQIGRYRVERLIGEGTFGQVYLAVDDQLKRHVAIKIARPDCGWSSEQMVLYVDEARTVAQLDHPGIVPVYDIGELPNGRCYVVSKYIEGRDLRQVMQCERMAWPDAAELVARAADALHVTHRQRVVHRDVKPTNILIDAAGHPHLVDFGLALHEDAQPGRKQEVSGSPAYMAPEQVRGHAHLLDGRADIWALGVILYELLTGCRPFRSELVTDLFEEIEHREPRPLRMMDERIPRELERITLKCLAKSPAERYLTADDLAADLRCWAQSFRSDQNASGTLSSYMARPAKGIIATLGGFGCSVTLTVSIAALVVAVIINTPRDTSDGVTVMPTGVRPSEEVTGAGASGGAGAAGADRDPGRIFGTITYNGTPPTLPPLVTAANVKAEEANVCKPPLIGNDTLVVNRENRGIQFVFVYIEKSPAEVPQQDLPPVVFDNKDCRFVPHAVFVQTGQTINVTNSDPIAHNVHPYPLRNAIFTGIVQAGGVPAPLVYQKPEKLPVEIKCDFHAWMKGYHLVLDHPWGAVTDADGDFELPVLPPGRYDLKVWHEKAGYLERSVDVTVNGDQELKLKFEPAKFAQFDGPRPKSVSLAASRPR